LTEKVFKVESPRSGFVIKVETEEIGHAIAEAGGGRVRMEDQIDPAVGFLAEVKIGDEVRPGDELGLVYCEDSGRRQRAAARIQAAYEIDDAPPAELPVLIKEVIDR
jgi:thymidine phosphorylase